MQTFTNLGQHHPAYPPSRTDTQSSKHFPLSSGSRLDQCRSSCSRLPMCRPRRWRAGLLMMLFACLPLVQFAQSTSTLAALTSPIPGSQLTGTRVAFTWTAGEGASYYELRLGTTGVGSSDLYDRSETEAFSATVSGLPTNAETVYARLRSKIAGTWQSIDYTYTAELIKLSVSPTNVAFGDVALNSPAMQPITLSSTGTAPLIIKAVTLTGTGYTVSGATLPVTLNPGQATTLSVQFDPTAVGAASGHLTIASNSSTESKTVIGLSATGELVLATELSALSCGSTSMTGSGTDSCTVTLTAGAPSFGFSVSLSSSNTAVSVPATVTVPANASSGVFTATVSSVGTAQAATLTASALSVSKTLALQLNAYTPTLTVATSSSPSNYGGAVTFTATISSDPPGTVTFYDGGAVIGTGVINGTTATFTTSSLIVGSQSITASWPGNVNYGAVTSSAITQMVNKATPTINWITPAAIAYGTALSGTQLDASSTVAGTFSYSPALGTVLTAGSHAITATFTPTVSTDYATATSSVSMTVNEATPAITWATPAAILYGTALSGTQLDASSTVAGTFSYTPAAGTVLKAGSQALSVTFTPTDTTDYQTATAAVALTVNEGAPTITWATPTAILYGTALSGTQLNAASTVAGTFSYTPAAGTVLKAGSQALSVTFTPTDTTDYQTATASVALTVNEGTAAIAWAAPAGILYGTALSGTQLDASSTVAGTFAYSPTAGTVLKAGSQTLSVTFTPTDTTDYTTAMATVGLTVNTATPAITWATPAAIPYGTALSGTQLDASSTVAGTFAYTPAAGTVLKAGSQALSVTFTPTDATDYSTATAIVTLTVNASATTPALTWAVPVAITYGAALSGTQLDASSTVAGTFAYTPAAGTVLKAGSQVLSVTFTPTDTTDYSTATATVGLTVNTATPAITWATPVSILYGTALSGTQLNAFSTVAGTFSYSPAAGTVLTAGSHAIAATFTPSDSADYATAASSVSITVNVATPAITWAGPAAILYGTALSGTQLDASSTVAGTFAYTPAAGTVLKAGSQTLSVTYTPTDITDYKTATTTVALTVNEGAPAITWATPAAILYGTALSGTQLDASSSVAGTFSYSPALGTVLTAGGHAITATFTPTDSTDYATATSSVTITVNAAPVTITWPAPAAILYGTALSGTQLDASSSVAGTFAYSPALGTVLTAGGHSITATFTPTDSTDYATATSSVTITVNAAPVTITWPAPAAILYGTALSGTQLDASSSVAGTFAYSPALGTVLTAGGHAITATFSPTDTADYVTATANVTLTVNAGTPPIVWATPAVIAYGTALSSAQLDASSIVAGTFSYSPVTGTVLAAGSHTITVTFTPTDSTDYTTATGTVVLTVNTATSTITWAPPVAIAYGTALSATQLDATASVAGTFVYTPAAGTVLAAGSQSLTVTFTPTNTTNYTTATATVTLTVNKTASIITWATPAAILNGTALSSTQLDASSTIPGTFVYSPAAGTVLAAGSQTLSVTFTPTDTTDYTTATQTVTLTVNPSTPTLTINATSVPFGDVVINTPATQSVTLTSTGTSAVTVNSAVVTGTGFTVAGATFPMALTPGQMVTLSVEFDPTAAGAATGQLTITSTSSTNGTAAIALTGTGMAASYAVDLSWDAPSSSPDPVAGYNIYRAPSGSTSYQLLNSSVDSLLTFVDSTVQNGLVYDYIAKSVDASGVESAASNMFSITIP